MKKTALDIRNDMELFWAKRHLARLLRRIDKERWCLIREQALELYGQICHRCGSDKKINVTDYRKDLQLI